MQKNQVDAEIEALSHQVIGCAIEVHRVLGPGFLESVYEEALCIELASQNIKFEQQYAISVFYKGHTIGKGKIDILVNEQIVVELKTVERFETVHFAQVLSYLKVTKCPLGLLLNFNVPVLKNGLKRFILT